MNLVKHQWPDVGKIYLHNKDPFKDKYQLFISRREKVRIKEVKNPKAYIVDSQTIDDVYEDWEDYKKGKMLIVLGDMIADMETNKKLSPIVTDS